MNINIQVTDLTNDIKEMADKQLAINIEKIVSEKLRNVDFDAIIIKRIDFIINQSKYVSDLVIRNFVQQKISREITKKILP